MIEYAFFSLMNTFASNALPVDTIGVFRPTEAQKKIVSHPFFQTIVIFGMFYVTTKSLVLSVLLTAAYLSMKLFLFNEHSRFNVFSRDFLEAIPSS